MLILTRHACCSWLSYTEEVATEVPLGGDIVQRLQRFGTYGRLKQIALRKVAHNIAGDSAVLADIKGAFQKLDPQGTGWCPSVNILKASMFAKVSKVQSPPHPVYCIVMDLQFWLTSKQLSRSLAPRVQVSNDQLFVVNQHACHGVKD